MWRSLKTAVAGSAFFGSVVTGYAADLPVKAPPLMVAPAFSWTGPYIGAHIGGGQSRTGGDNSFDPLFPGFIVLPPTAAIPTVFPGQLSGIGGGGNKSGIIGGGQIGYNWQVKQFVFGAEADIDATGLRGSTASASRSFGPPVLLGTVTQTVDINYGAIDWMASFRARFGFAADRALFYATGGAALAQFGGSTTTVTNGAGISTPAGTFTAANGGSSTRWGWTIGGGIEWAFHKNWSLAGEYRHTDFGSRSVTVSIPDGFGALFATRTISSKLTIDQLTARLNFRF
jgi:outer membrane immunogenic protein